MELTELYTNAKAKMEKCMTSLERDFSAVRAGRANPAVLDKVMVDYYGVPTPVIHMFAGAATPKVAAADHNADFHAQVSYFFYRRTNLNHRVVVDPGAFFAGQHFAAEL